MAIYTVLTPPPGNGDTDPMDYVFVKEGVAWPALFFAELWLIFRRMWLVLIVYVVVGVATIWLSSEMGDTLPGAIVLLGRLLFALEGNELRRWTLKRRGFRLVDVVEGKNVEEAEIHFFARITEGTVVSPATPPATAPSQPPPTPPKLGQIQPSAEDGDVVGLFPAPQPQGGGWS